MDTEMTDVVQEQPTLPQKTLISPASPIDPAEVEDFESLSIFHRDELVKEKLAAKQGDIRAYVVEAKRLFRLSNHARKLVVHVSHCYFDAVKKQKGTVELALRDATLTVTGQKIMTGRAMNNLHGGRIQAQSYFATQALEEEAGAKILALEESLEDLKDREWELAFLVGRHLVQMGMSPSRMERYLRAPVPRFDVGPAPSAAV